MYDHGEFSLRLPTTFTPRYIPPMDTKFAKRDLVDPRDREDVADVENPDERDDFKTAGQVNQNKHDLHKLPIATGVDPATGWRSVTVKTEDYLAIHSPRAMSHQAPRLTLSAIIDAGFPLEYIHSLYHPIRHHRKEGRYHVGFKQQSEPMNRDVVLRWKPRLDRHINAAVFKESLDGDDYHLLMLLPNGDGRVPPRLPREIIFVIDTSGSMSGVSMRQAKAALLAGLERLSPGDRFNIIDFDSAARQLFSEPKRISETALSQAEAYIQQLNAEGGTNMADALKRAFSVKSHARSDNEHVRQIVFITDGSVGNEEALFTQIVQDIQNSRLFTVGIGSAPNSHFMREAATMGRGGFTHIGDINAVTEKMNTLFQKLAHPVLRNITIDWSGAGGDVEVFPELPPDLYLGEPLVLYVKTPKNALANAEQDGIQSAGGIPIKGSMAGTDWSQLLPVKTSKHQAGIAKQWARQKIRHLMSPRHSMSPEDRKQAVTALALQHQLLSRYTSFVAVEERISRPAQARQQSATIPNAMPHGNTMALPNTATPTLVYFFLGLIALSVLILEVFIGRYFRLITLGAVKS